MNTIKFTYNNLEYFFNYYTEDPSGLGCIAEIVNNNEYQLNEFVNNVNKSFIDIGANCGVATIILAKQNPQSNVYAFEPDKTVFELLRANVNANQLNNVIIHNYAVSKSGIEQLEICIHPQYSGGNTTYSNKDAFTNTFNTNIVMYNVPTISLDDIINKYKITTIECLKIDCEGGEYDIIYDSTYVKTGFIKNIVGEFHNLHYNTKVHHTAEELLIYCKQYITGLCKITMLTL